MVGVILAGGNGIRLLPMTKILNKHVLPLASGKLMIQHSVEKLSEAGINRILVVTGGNHFGGIAEYLGSGKDFGVNLTYRVQDNPNGIAGALSLAEGFAGSESMCVILGDNIFEDSLENAYGNYSGKGAQIVLTEVNDPQRFGVAVIRDGKVQEIVEKPNHPDSNYIVTGIYFYDNSVFDIIRRLNPSDRGELEITDVNNAYLENGGMSHTYLHGWWTDAGTHESYRRANDLIIETDT